MTQNAPHSSIHYELERIDYSLSGEELEKLSSSNQNSWKDFCILCLGVGVPCTINAIVEVNKQQQFSPTLSFNLNLVIGIVGIILGIVFGISWWKSRSPIKELVERIKNRPKIPITPSMLNVGALEESDDG